MAGRRMANDLIDDDDDEDIDSEEFFGSDSEISGPPPLASEHINAIPTAQITQDQVEEKLQCTVCKQEFVLNECVKKLQCQHVYHEECIRPWLQLHSTCPICRQNQSPAGDFYNPEATHVNRLTMFLNGMIQDMRERRQRRRNQAIISFSAPSLMMETEPIPIMEVNATSDSSTSSSSSSISSVDSHNTVDMPTIEICSSNEDEDMSNDEDHPSVRIMHIHPSSSTTDSTSTDSD